MIELTPFKTSIFMGEHPQPNSLVDSILELKQMVPTVIKSNRGGWQSPSYSSPHDFMLDILYELGDRVLELYKHYGIRREFVTLRNYWFNINERYSYNLTHKHPGSMFSAVWYVKTPHSSGDIVFERPDAMLEYWDVDNNQHSTSQLRFTPKENMFFIFPSYIPHYVEMNNSSEERISVAFNFG